VLTQLREEVFFTKGRVIVRGKTVTRGEKRKIDYLLFYKPNLPIAIVEAKDNNHSVGAGMEQATERPPPDPLSGRFLSTSSLRRRNCGPATGPPRVTPANRKPSPLWKAKAKKRILFLVDRNILADQTKTNDFKPFGKAMTKRQ